MILRDRKSFIDVKASEKVAAGEAAPETNANGQDVSVEGNCKVQEKR